MTDATKLLWKKGAVLTTGSYVSAAGNILLNLTMISMLPTRDIGLLNAGNLMKDYLLHATPGEVESLRSIRSETLANQDENILVSNIASISLLNIAIILAISFYSIPIIISDHQNVGVYEVFSLLFAIEYLQFFFLNYLKGKERFFEIRNFLIATGLLSCVVIPLTIWGGVVGYLTGRLLSSLVGLIVIYKLARVPLSGLRLPSRMEFTSIIKVGLPLQLMVLATIVLESAPRIIAINFFGYEMAGLLAVALFFTIPFSQIFNNLATVMFANFFSGEETSFSLHGRGVKARFLVALGGVFFVSILKVLLVLFFERYDDIFLQIVVILCASILNGIYIPQQTYLQAAGRGFLCSGIYLTIAALIFILSFSAYRFEVLNFLLLTSILFFCYSLGIALFRYFAVRQFGGSLSFSDIGGDVAALLLVIVYASIL